MTNQQVPILECKQEFKPHTKDPLTEDQSEKLQQLRDLKPWIIAYEDEEVSTGDLDHNQKKEVSPEFWLNHFTEFCDDESLLRYLRANVWDVAKACSGLVKTLKWRRVYQPNLLTPSDVETAWKCGKSYLNGFDKQGRAIIYIRNHRDTKDRDYEAGLRSLIFALECAFKLMPEQDRVVLIFDFSQYTASNAPPMSASKQFLTLFAQHYPERLGMVAAVNCPWYFWVAYKIISPMIHPVTKSKIRFVDLKTQSKITVDQESTGIWTNLLNFVDVEELESDFGGNFDFEYNHEVYYEALNNRLSNA